MSYFAVAFAQAGSSWTAAELDLDDVEDLDGLVELAATETDGAIPAFVAVEENDEWLALLRLDGDADARVFLSDTRVLTTSTVAGLFADALEGDGSGADDADDDDTDDEESTAGVIDAEPAGDAGLLADLGLPASQLLKLCAAEGALPSDITAAICEQIGCGEACDAVRGA